MSLPFSGYICRARSLYLHQLAPLGPARLNFDSEDGGGTFQRKVCSYTDYRARYTRRWQSLGLSDNVSFCCLLQRAVACNGSCGTRGRHSGRRTPAHISSSSRRHAIPKRLFSILRRCCPIWTSSRLPLASPSNSSTCKSHV